MRSAKVLRGEEPQDGKQKEAQWSENSMWPVGKDMENKQNKDNETDDQKPQGGGEGEQPRGGLPEVQPEAGGWWDGGPAGTVPPEGPPTANRGAQGGKPEGITAAIGGGDGGQGGEGGGESQGSYQEFCVPSSVVFLCVLNQSIHHEESPFNPIHHVELPFNSIDHKKYLDFLNGPVNFRTALQETKLNCIGEGNLFQAYVENRDPAHSPILGSITATVSSFKVVTGVPIVGD